MSDTVAADSEALFALVEELCESHLDTVEMALELPAEYDWESHIVYVRALHREAQELLARMSRDVDARDR